VVHSPTLDEMDEIYSIRCALTPLSIARSIRAVSAEELELAGALCTSMYDCADAAEWVELNRQFHHVLDGASHSPHLSSVLGRLADISVVYVNLSFGPGSNGERRDDADDDHRRLVEAFAARDVDEASAVAVAHLTRTIDSVRRAFVERGTDPATDPATEHTTEYTTGRRAPGSAAAVLVAGATDHTTHTNGGPSSGGRTRTARRAVEEQWT